MGLMLTRKEEVYAIVLAGYSVREINRQAAIAVHVSAPGPAYERSSVHTRTYPPHQKTL